MKFLWIFACLLKGEGRTLFVVLFKTIHLKLCLRNATLKQTVSIYVLLLLYAVTKRFLSSDSLSSCNCWHPRCLTSLLNKEGNI